MILVACCPADIRSATQTTRFGRSRDAESERIANILRTGGEDMNAHEELRNDPLLAVLVEKSNPSKEALEGKSTLNRLELTKETASQKERYKKIVLDHGAVDRLLVEVFLEA